MKPVPAVVTTGIYCRPGCGARPLARNVRTFPVAAAAEAAGYRACLQCRPYRLAELVLLEGPELVCRAVRLILGGALDQATEEQLGRRIGVSGRHLRRLFVQHLGVTPDGLARSARAHFARRLLDDSDLSIIQVAFAAGFGSVRQFNRACQEVFHESPRALRARRRKRDRLVADGGLMLRLSYQGQLDWEAVLAQLAVRAIPGVEDVAGTTYRRTIVVDGDPGVIELWPGGDGELLLRAHLPHWSKLIHLVARARRLAGIDVELDGALAGLGDDPVIGPLVRARPGVRIAGTWDAFETGVQAIVADQATAVAATTTTRRLVERFGTPVHGLGQLGLTHLWPAPHTLVSADLAGLGLTRPQQSTIRSFAAAVAADRIRLDGSVPLDELVGSITAIDGVGEETAQYLALRLGEPDAFPLTGRGAAESWCPWRALAATHLWLADGAETAEVLHTHAA